MRCSLSQIRPKGDASQKALQHVKIHHSAKHVTITCSLSVYTVTACALNIAHSGHGLRVSQCNWGRSPHLVGLAVDLHSVIHPCAAMHTAVP